MILLENDVIKVEQLDNEEYDITTFADGKVYHFTKSEMEGVLNFFIAIEKQEKSE